eukprot:SAG11_NODE_17542_length_515_cov_1.225962_2_plen_44_part_01
MPLPQHAQRTAVRNNDAANAGWSQALQWAQQASFCLNNPTGGDS